MCRFIEIDLTRGADDVCSSYTIGRDGENRAETLKIILPEKYLNCNILLEFELADGSKFMSKPLAYNEVIEYHLESYLMVEGLMRIGVIAVDLTSGAVIKPFEKTFVVSEAINALPEEMSPYSIVTDHEKRIALLESNQAQTDFLENDPNAASYIKNRSHFDTPGYTVAWDGVIGDKETMTEGSDDDDDDDFICYVKVSDELPDEYALSKISTDDIVVATQDGETFLLTDLAEEYRENIVETIAAGSCYTAEDCVIFVLSDEYDVSGGEGIALTKGIWFMYTEEFFVSGLKVPSGAKAIDLKYIPDKAFGSIEVVSDNSSQVIIGIFNKDGKETNRVYIPKGKVPVKGVDYMTSYDISTLVSRVISELPKWNGGSY